MPSDKRKRQPFVADLSGAIDPAKYNQILNKLSNRAPVEKDPIPDRIDQPDQENTPANLAAAANDAPLPPPMAAAVNLTEAAILTATANIAPPANLAEDAKTAEAAILTPHANLAAAVKKTAAVTVARVNGELRIPNSIVDNLLPLLEPSEAVIYLRLYRLSHGYHKDTCIVSTEKLGKITREGNRTVQRAFTRLEQLGLIERQAAVFTGPVKGNVIKVNLPEIVDDLAAAAKMTAPAKMAGDAKMADIKKDLNKISEKAMRSIIAQYHQLHTGGKIVIADMSAYCKEQCARRGVLFDADLFNRLV